MSPQNYRFGCLQQRLFQHLFVKCNQMGTIQVFASKFESWFSEMAKNCNSFWFFSCETAINPKDCVSVKTFRCTFDQSIMRASKDSGKLVLILLSLTIPCCAPHLSYQLFFLSLEFSGHLKNAKTLEISSNWKLLNISMTKKEKQKVFGRSKSSHRKES